MWVQEPVVLFELCSAFTASEAQPRSGVTRFEEREAQTEDDGREWKDDDTQTSGGHRKVHLHPQNIKRRRTYPSSYIRKRREAAVLQTHGLQVDLWLLGRIAEYAEPASERMLRHISADVHKEQVYLPNIHQIGMIQ